MQLRRLLSLAALVLVAGAYANTEGDAVLSKINALKAPKVDREKLRDKAYVDSYMASLGDYNKQRNGLILELYKADPENPQTLTLLEERWQRFDVGRVDSYKDRLLADIASIRSAATLPAVKDLADYEETSVRMAITKNVADKDVLLDEFIAKHPKDPHGETLLVRRAFQASEDERPKLLNRFLTVYPNGKYAPMVRGVLKQKSEIGKPFALTFTDAIKGTAFDITSLKGKVVLVDFWATWCGPCVAKIPEVKSWYTKYQPKGFEVVGVSLDQPEDKGGLKALKAFVAKNELPWPQYYQGNYWQSDFSSSWGINSIPCTFLIDKKGVLRDINPQGEEEVIKKLLAE